MQSAKPLAVLMNRITTARAHNPALRIARFVITAPPPLTPGLDPEELNMESDAERWLLQLTVRIAQALLGRLESGRKVYCVFGEGVNPLMAEDA